jgi:UDP-GlcNAc:undecaprenyl-phosphate GlcNAc-1-phosphate transferase
MDEIFKVMGISSSLALICVAFFSALGFSLILVPVFRKLALAANILDRPGGRKEHSEATPLLGGVALFVACLLSLLVLVWLESVLREGKGLELRLREEMSFIFLGSVIIFITGLVDDFVGERLPFYYKLIGQIIGSSAAIAVLYYEQLVRLISGGVPFADYIYLLVAMGWMLTVINSFNFSDNINGLSTGLAVIAVLTAIIYLGSQVNTRHVLLGLILAGTMLGFIPYNFPKARIFLGDAGSMFIGYWVGVFLWPLTAGFFDGTRPLFGLDQLIPAVLVMGVPIYDAAFVVVMRWREKRPIYLGDNKHLSHRLVRCGFSRTESTLILWGVALIVAGIGAMSIGADYYVRYMALFIALSILLIITVLIVKKEKKTAVLQLQDADSKKRVQHGSRRIRADVSS